MFCKHNFLFLFKVTWILYQENEVAKDSSYEPKWFDLPCIKESVLNIPTVSTVCNLKKNKLETTIKPWSLRCQNSVFKNYVTLWKINGNFKLILEFSCVF